MAKTRRDRRVYEYDDAGNMTEKTVDSVVTTYGYDDIDQLTSEVRTGYSAAYTYDGNGNRLTKTLNGVTDSYSYSDCDELNQIIRGGVTIKGYTYDDAGRTTSWTTGAGTTSFSYDYEGRLAQITYPNSATNSFSYNTFNSRVSKLDTAGYFTYKRDGVGVAAPILSDGSAAYTPGISEWKSGATKSYHSDYMGTVSRMLNTAQATTDTKLFDAFGGLLASTGSSLTPFGFAGTWGYQQELENGLCLLGVRYYESEVGRFISRDPLRDGENWYSYCRNRPTKLIDPTGTTSMAVLALVALGGDVPIGPPGVRVTRNIRMVEMQLRNFQEDNENDPWQIIPGYGIKNGADYVKRKLEWFNDMVTDGGPWDYKTRGQIYIAFGNWHYGVVGSAAGFSDEVLLRAAGANQVSKESIYDPADGLPWGGPPYGDDPADQYWIRKGIEWYRSISASPSH